MAARMAALEARVLKLESGQVAAADLVGNYALYILGIEMTGRQSPVSGPPAEIKSETTIGALTLNADGTISGSFADSACSLRQGFWTVTCENGESGSGNPIEGIAWTVSNGAVVITQAGDETAVLTIGAGGRVLISGGTSTDVPNESWSNIVVAIRLPNP